MDDLTLIGAWMDEPPPAPSVTARGYQRLIALAAKEGGPPDTRTLPARRRMSLREKLGQPAALLAGGLGLTAAAVTAAIMATPAPYAIRDGSPAVGRAATGSHRSGQQILLAAAITAQARPAGSGRYWHVRLETAMLKIKAPPQFQDTYFLRSGASFITIKPGTVSPDSGPVGFWLAGQSLSFAQLQNLPTRPAALKAWVFSRVQHYDRVIGSQGKHLSTAMQAAEDTDETIGEITNLLSSLPAPPKVRAAAFRALALFPNVQSLGEAAGGQALLISDEWSRAGTKIVIDPVTSMVRSMTYGLIGKSGQLTNVKGSTLVITAGWTNHLPMVVPRPASARQ